MDSELAYVGPVVAFDLDDTLYSESDFLKSGFRAVAQMAFPLLKHTSYTDIDSLHNALIEVYGKGRNAFDWLAEQVEADSQAFINECVKTYRFHTPEIKPYTGVLSLLQSLSENGVRMGIITDGRALSQRNKIRALGIEKFFAPENIFISEECGCDKTSIDSWQMLVHHYPNACRFVYVGDNPAKDFRIPNMLGWTTIGLRDRGDNIHPQILSDNPLDAPQLWIDDIHDLLSAICGLDNWTHLNINAGHILDELDLK